VLVGYEVLDTDGGRLELPSTPVPPSEVVPFDDLAAAPDPGPTAAPAPTLVPAPRGLPPDDTGTAWDAVRRRVSGRPSLAVLSTAAVLALAIGYALGGTWATHRADQQRVAERSSRIAVIAAVTGIDTVPGSQVVDFTVRLANAGPLPVELVTSPEGAKPTTSRPVVGRLGGATTITAGGVLSASLRLAVDCTGGEATDTLLRVPVRTIDGVVHQIIASDDGPMQNAMYGQSPCTTGLPSLDAEIAGTLAHPLLRLHNTSNGPLQVEIDRDNSPFVAQSENFSVLRLSPSLPQVIPPYRTVNLSVTLSPWSCPRGLSVVLGSQVSPYVVLVAGYPGADRLARERAGVDLSALWGAALARNCL
jgi:hypothetical protein